ncbi:uncharacterized protein LOC142237760 [Haematobia irritans]|uniref:uncharacterized protein LOC142237760 n=1 Tax=Haematobia irritans TaxID=7368 RepID=UPI003F501728
MNNSKSQKLSPTNSWTVTKRKSCTTLLCEITRLKSQQKYLESHHGSLSFEPFYDDDDVTQSSPKRNSKVKDLELFKTELEEALEKYRQESRFTVIDIYHEIKTLRNKTLNANSLEKTTMEKIREDITGINTKIETLQTLNMNELQLLRSEFHEYEKQIDTFLN